MSSSAGSHPVYRSGVVRVLDYRCAHTQAGICGEECNEGASIVFPRRGVFRKRSNRGEIVADPCAVVFFDDGEHYRIDHPVPGGDECTVFHLPPGILTEMLSDCGVHPRGSREVACFPLDGMGTDGREFMVHERLRRMATRAAPEDRLGLDEAILNLCARVTAWAATAAGIRGKRHRADTVRAHREWCYRARAYLAQRFREEVSLDEMARHVHCSPYHLCRVFRADTGMSLHRFQVRLRLRAALSRMSEARSDLTMLALDLGFSNHSHFTRWFRREFGVSPSEARRLSRRGLGELSKIVQV